jgi:hypothetical protein
VEYTVRKRDQSIKATTAIKSKDTSGSPPFIGTPELVKSAKSDGEEVDLSEANCDLVRLKPKAAGDGWEVFAVMLEFKIARDGSRGLVVILGREKF